MKANFEQMTEEQEKALKILIPQTYLKFTNEEQAQILKNGRFDNYEDVCTKRIFDFVKGKEWNYLYEQEFMLEKDAFTNFKNGWLYFMAIDKEGNSDDSPAYKLNNQMTFNPDIHTIDIDNSLNNLLHNTKNDIFARPFPYSYIFFNRNLELEPNNYCFGISVFSSKCPCGECDKFVHYISLIGYNYNQNKLWKGCFSITHNKILLGGYEKSYDGTLNIEKICKETAQVVVNLFDFINHPEIMPKVIKWTNNENRIKKGKMPIANRLVLKITGKMYHYLYEEQSMPSNTRHYNCTFDVKGTYIHFYSKMRFHRLYSLTMDELRERGYQIDATGLISKWRMGFVKGIGIKKTKRIILTK